jgi:glycosyltransferase involved in cell wall biosynthesis
MKPLKILLDARMISEQVHGIGRYASGLLKGLEEREQDVTILSLKKDETRKTILCKLPFAHPLEALELTSKIRNTKFDIYHFPSFALPLKIKPNTVVTIHDLIHMHQGSPAHQFYYKTVVKRGLLKSQGIAAVSDWTKGELHRLLDIPEEKIIVIRNGLEKSFFAKVLSPSTIPQTFLCLTNLKGHKNALTLLKAAQILWSKNYDFNLEISLSGAELPEEWAITPEERKRIHLIKKASDGDILTRLRKCRALVSPSLYEGYNYPVAEALAQGKEVILSMGSSHDEFKSPLINVYGTPRDTLALAHCMEKALNQAPSTSTVHNVKSLDTVVDETLELYRQVAYDFSHERKNNSP